MHTQRAGGTLTPSQRQDTEKRAATCRGYGPVLQTQHAMVYGASLPGCHPILSVEGSWCLVPAAASVSAASTAAPERTGQGASWNWTRWTERQPRACQQSSQAWLSERIGFSIPAKHKGTTSQDPHLLKNPAIRKDCP